MLRKKKFIIVMGSILLSLMTALVGQNLNKFGFPFPFMFYKGGHMETLGQSYEIIMWDNLKHVLFRVDYFTLNFLLFYVVLMLLIKGIEKIKR